MLARDPVRRERPGSDQPRPREHDDATREALRTAAEALFEASGGAGVSVRAVADAAETTTRAVYSLFGSQNGLVVDAMAQRAYEILTAGLDDEPETDDPAADLVACALHVFRPFVLQLPALFRIAFQRIVPDFEPGPELVAARRAGLARLTAKVRRLEDAGVLRGTSVEQAVIEFQAMCEGLGNFEMRGSTMRMLPEGDEEAVWRTAFAGLVRGFDRRPRRR